MVKIPEAAPIGLVKISEVRSSQQWAGDLDLIHDNDKFLLVYNHDDCWIYVFFGTTATLGKHPRAPLVVGFFTQQLIPFLSQALVDEILRTSMGNIENKQM